MKSMSSEKDIKMKPYLLPFTTAAEAPIAFFYGDREIHGIPEDFKVRVSRRIINADILLYDIIAVNNRGLELHIECREYMDYPAREWVASFTNAGEESSDIISKIRIEGVLPLPLKTLYHGNGDNCSFNSYKWTTTPVTERVSLSPVDGTSCNGAFPYMRLAGEELGVNLAVGWSGNWHADIEAVKDGVFLSVGQSRCRMRIYPGETIRTPRVTLVGYSGDESRGRNMWRRWYLTHILPRKDGQPIKPMCCMHHFMEGGHEEFTGATEKGQLLAVDTYIKRGVHPDVLWMDAGWYPCDYRWMNLGDWRPDPERFPNGLAPIGEKCKNEGITFLLWFEPERAIVGSPLEQEHPEWMLRMRRDDGSIDRYSLVNLGDPDCCDYIINMVDNIIKESGVGIYRQDFNFDAYPRWIQNEEPDREGALENLHVQGYYRYWDTLLERNPGLIIDSCCSGGRRNDLETMRRSVTLHYTDVGYGVHPTKQLQHRQMFEWIPYFRAHVLSWDDPESGHYTGYGNIVHPVDKYAFYAALTPAITDTLDHNADDSLFELSRQMQPIWRKAAELMLSCDYYPLTECREDQSDFYAMAFYDPERGDGFLNVVSNNRNTERVFTANLDMLEADAVYTLTEAESGTEAEYSGKQLAEGYEVELEARSGVVYFIKRN